MENNNGKPSDPMTPSAKRKPHPASTAAGLGRRVLSSITGRRDDVAVEEMTQWQLIRLRFSHHRLAVLGMYVLMVMYLIALFAEVVAPGLPGTKHLEHTYCPPQIPRISLQDGFYAYPMRRHVDPVTFQKTYSEDRTTRILLRPFTVGEPYKLWKIIPMQRHLFGISSVRHLTGEPASVEPTFFFFGTDKYGRDLFTRIVYGTRISLSVGLIGIAMTFFLGMFIGGVSGYLGGKVDLLIQRFIEILSAIPQLPLWLALGAAMPGDWSPLKAYFAITIVLSFMGWTGLARVVRGKILSLREEDYATAARLIGVSDAQVLFRHLLPGFTSHILVSLTLSVPGMILGETSLSFLGLGLRPPVVSWGVMLQDCMDIKAVRFYPWLLLPVAFLILTVLCFNFFGDGLRDAADPYSSSPSSGKAKRKRLKEDKDRKSSDDAAAKEMDKDNVLELQGLSTHFDTESGELKAVDGVALTVKRGKILAVVGESGCGKSVTSYSVMRLIQSPGRIAGGRVLVRDRNGDVINVAALSDNDERLFHLRGGIASMIFQEPMTALSPVHTIGNQICEGIHLHQNVTPSEAEKMAIEMLGKVGLPGAEKRMVQYPHELSGGMRQRVVIAMALVCRPVLLIADEPTTALDVTIQAQILRLIKKLQDDMGTSVLFITHDLGVVAQVADEVAVMYLGRVVEQGDVRTVLKNPKHPYTMELLQSLPGMHQRGEKLATIKGTVPSLNAIPPGCPFHPRCPEARSGVCDVGRPPDLEDATEDHRVACCRWREVAQGARSEAQGTGNKGRRTGSEN